MKILLIWLTIMMIMQNNVNIKEKIFANNENFDNTDVFKSSTYYDDFFDEYTIVSRQYLKNPNIYIFGDGKDFEPTYYVETIKIDNETFPVWIIHYKNKDFLYLQNNKTENNNEINSLENYLRKDTEYCIRKWNRYDLSESYVFSTDQTDEENLEYLMSVLP